jgi:hypothetical protein
LSVIFLFTNNIVNILLKIYLYCCCGYSSGVGWGCRCVVVVVVVAVIIDVVLAVVIAAVAAAAAAAAAACCY